MSGNESIAVAHYDQVTTWPRDELQADIVHILSLQTKTGGGTMK